MIRAAKTGNKAFKRLREAILAGEFPPGMLLKEMRLAREWKISRTPIREAMRHAAELGLVVLRPNQAPLVRQLNRRDIDQIYDLREVLETYALRLSWDRIGARDLRRLRVVHHRTLTSPSSRRVNAFLKFEEVLHNLWIKNCGNAWLKRAVEQLLIFRPNVFRIFSEHPEIAEVTFHEHEQILQHMEKRNLAGATRSLQHHVRNARRYFMKVIPQTGPSTSAGHGLRGR
jgi:DNA-binding GntR family transcriptional regulator